LTITFWGLLLTFGTLGLMVLPIYLVNKYQEAHPPKEEAAETPSDEPVPCPPEEDGMANEAAVAGAIAVSILAARRGAAASSQLGSALEVGSGQWWTRSDN
jgi:hypothetical protein